MCEAIIVIQNCFIHLVRCECVVGVFPLVKSEEPFQLIVCLNFQFMETIEDSLFEVYRHMSTSYICFVWVLILISSIFATLNGLQREGRIFIGFLLPLKDLLKSITLVSVTCNHDFQYQSQQLYMTRKYIFSSVIKAVGCGLKS